MLQHSLPIAVVLSAPLLLHAKKKCPQEHGAGLALQPSHSCLLVFLFPNAKKNPFSYCFIFFLQLQNRFANSEAGKAPPRCLVISFQSCVFQAGNLAAGRMAPKEQDPRGGQAQPRHHAVPQETVLVMGDHQEGSSPASWGWLLTALLGGRFGKGMGSCSALAGSPHSPGTAGS